MAVKKAQGSSAKSQRRHSSGSGRFVNTARSNAARKSAQTRKVGKK
jgi:hypothetical protein